MDIKSVIRDYLLTNYVLRACSHEPGTVNYSGVKIAPGQVHRHLITTNLSEFL